MQKISPDAQAREQLERAASTPGGRSATTVDGGQEHTLRQTTGKGRGGDLIVSPQPATASRGSTTRRCASPPPDPADV
ncbi:hypothetical protein [Streptomyces sp. MA5143a]|uniref:hypothetical protein n=1 Tax=Streptomyces sp. MA5143a TaxID=2083010 RepID=UPI000D2EF0AD|nr:hypothetical protein SMA5143A_7569 [Streptomyces sp. MA5143a]